jgi:hypothetical protein
MRPKSSVVYEHEPNAAATGLLRRIEQAAGQIGRAECVIPRFAQLGPEQGPVPLVGEDEQNSGSGWRR